MRPDTSGTVAGLPLIVRDTCTHNVVRYRELQYTYTYPPCIRVLSITHTYIPSYNESAYTHTLIHTYILSYNKIPHIHALR